MKQKLKFEFNLEQAGDGLMITSPEIEDFSIFLGGTENKDAILNTLSPSLNLYLSIHYDLAVERCLIDLQDLQTPIEAGQKLECVVIPG